MFAGRAGGFGGGFGDDAREAARASNGADSVPRKRKLPLQSATGSRALPSCSAGYTYSDQRVRGIQEHRAVLRSARSASARPTWLR
jgi:hypothetical protein